MASSKQISCHLVHNYNNYKADLIHSGSLPAEGFSMKYDPNDEYIAIGCYNGTKTLLAAKDKKTIQTVQNPREDPITCLKWRPMTNSATRVIGFCNTAGLFEYIHAPTLKLLFAIEEKENSLHCCDFTTSGGHFATAGKDCNIRVYDQNTKSVSVTLGCAEWNYRGHSNRIFSIKFIDENTLVSGGWDSVIHLWDLRAGKSMKSIFGPHVAGDTIDYRAGELLIGCYSAKNQLQLWDFNKFQMREAISWTPAEDKQKVAYVYTAAFHKYQKNTIIAGSSVLNEVKVFHKQAGSYSLSTAIRQVDGGCFSIDSSPRRPELGFTTAKSNLYFYSQTS